MKTVYISLVLATIGITSIASASNEQKCSAQARQFLAMNAKVMIEDPDTASSFSYIQGATVGDAGLAVEIDLYKSPSQGSIYKVELDGETCSIRNVEVLQ